MFTNSSRKIPRISLFLPSLGGGGAERVMVNLANGFAASGMDVDLVLANAEGPYLNEVPSNVRIIDLGVKRVVYAVPGLVRYLRRNTPDCMLTTLSHANIAAVLARKLAGVSTRLVVREANTLTMTSADVESFRERFIPFLVDYSYKRADAIVAVSNGVASDLLAKCSGLSSNKVHAIMNPVVTANLYAKAGESVDHPWFNNRDCPVILAVGRLTPQKDFSTLLRAFALVRNARKARLIILGEGQQRSLLADLASQLNISDSLDMPGFVSNPYAWMRHASLFVLSSAWEGLPGTLIQAMACGTKVVSTNCPSGPAEILEDGRWGRLVEVGDFEGLGNAINAALDDTAPPDVNARAGDFGIDQAVDAYLKVLLPAFELQRN